MCVINQSLKVNTTDKFTDPCQSHKTGTSYVMHICTCQCRRPSLSKSYSINNVDTFAFWCLNTCGQLLQAGLFFASSPHLKSTALGSLPVAIASSKQLTIQLLSSPSLLIMIMIDLIGNCPETECS